MSPAAPPISLPSAEFWLTLLIFRPKNLIFSGLTVSLPEQTNSTGNPTECAAFASGKLPGDSAQTAGCKNGRRAGWQAKANPGDRLLEFFNYSRQLHSYRVCLHGRSATWWAPTACLGWGSGLFRIAVRLALRAGFPATGRTTPAHPSGCTDTTESLAQQVQTRWRPSTTDNNGVIIELLRQFPAAKPVSAASQYLWIGTQLNNGLEAQRFLELAIWRFQYHLQKCKVSAELP